MKVSPGFFIGAVLGAVLTAGHALAGQIIHPPNGSRFDSGSIEVSGFRAAKDGPGTVRILSEKAGSGIVRQAVTPGVFSFTVELPPGGSKIILNGDLVKVFYDDGSAPAEAAKFGAADQHAVDNDCEDCHLFEADEATLSEEVPGLCGACHDDVGVDEQGEVHENSHPPVEEGECLECHVFHGLSISRLPAGVAAVCYGCHDDYASEGAQLHPPLEEGECTECHRPHGSEHAPLLESPRGELCLTCHDDPSVNDGGEGWSAPHPALEEGCLSCHSPHVSMHGSLLKSPQPAVCGECHDDKNVNESGGQWAAPHSPVEEGSCSECHLPHGSEEAALLTLAVPELCGECHDDKNAGQEGGPWRTPHPPVEGGECAACHLPHGSEQAGLLAGPVPGLCGECHDDMLQNESGLPWEFPHQPAARGECFACHLPHGSTVPALLQNTVKDHCRRCHRSLHDFHLFFEDTKEIQVPADFPVAVDGSMACTACHLPHGSGNSFLWRGTFAAFCIRCHKY